MAQKSRNQEKLKKLAEKGSLNSRADKVYDDLFVNDEFFDPYDLMQVKYEMVRRVQVDHWRPTDAARNFGFSRVAFYEIKKAIDEQGLVGIMPQKRGPKNAHKLTEEVLRFIDDKLRENNMLKARALAKIIAEEFGLDIHIRTIEKALQAKKKTNRAGSHRGEIGYDDDQEPL